ncbi:MAG: hypothetical protein KAH10_00575 [Flavobacteriales bacterium]|nr:hypothetical protein [Flavobacteriales bacterium]
MKKLVILSVLMIMMSFSAFAAKDINAWKNEVKVERQFSVFKKNLNLWNGYLSFKEFQINDFYKALSDTINNLETTIDTDRTTISSLKSTITSLNGELSSTQSKLDESLTREESFSTLGIQVSKTNFATIMYSIAIVLLVLVGIFLFLYKQSQQITREAKSKLYDLEKEFDQHKKNNLEKCTKLNRELHDCKMKKDLL